MILIFLLYLMQFGGWILLKSLAACWVSHIEALIRNLAIYMFTTFFSIDLNFLFKLDYFVRFTMAMHCLHYIVNNKPGKMIAEINPGFTTYMSVPNHKNPWNEYRAPWNIELIFVQLIQDLDMFIVLIGKCTNNLFDVQEHST